MTTQALLVPTEAIRAWIDRPAEARQGEASHRGKIPRPLNAFMLYRKQHSSRVKETVSDTNETQISVAAGSRWRTEPEAVKQLYRELATRERINHALAFPGYRFAPRQISSVASPYHVVQESSPRWPVRPSCYQRTSRACAGTDAGLDMNGQDAMLFRNLAQWLSGNRV